jgi:hypothetical protein
VLKKTKEHDDEPEAEEFQHNKKIVEAVSVKEQRISHMLMALGLIGTMTGPLLTVLHTMPRGLFSGVFFVVGWGSIGGNGIMDNIIHIMTERRFVDPADMRLELSKWRIAYYISFQAFGVLSSVAISQTIAAIGFPVIITSLIPLRWIILPRIFTEKELLILDAPTADADVVLASMGGQPTRPEVALAERRRHQQNVDGEKGAASSSGISEANSDMKSRDGWNDEEGREIETDRERMRKEHGIQPTEWTGHD